MSRKQTVIGSTIARLLTRLRTQELRLRLKNSALTVRIWTISIRNWWRMWPPFKVRHNTYCWPFFALRSMLVIFMRDISEAYSQAETNGHITVYIIPPTLFSFHPGMLLRVDSPLYDKRSSGLCRTTYIIKRPQMFCSTGSVLPFYTRFLTTWAYSWDPRIIISLERDKTFNKGNKVFIYREEPVCSKFFS